MPQTQETKRTALLSCRRWKEKTHPPLRKIYDLRRAARPLPRTRIFAPSKFLESGCHGAGTATVSETVVGRGLNRNPIGDPLPQLPAFDVDRNRREMHAAMKAAELGCHAVSPGRHCVVVLNKAIVRNLLKLVLFFLLLPRFGGAAEMVPLLIVCVVDESTVRYTSKGNARLVSPMKFGDVSVL